MAEREELGSNLLRFAKRASASKANGYVSQKLKGRLQRAAIATAAFRSLSASQMLSNPFGLYVRAFDCASNRIAGGAL